MSATEWFDLANKLGAIGALLCALFVYGVHREWWIMGTAHRRELVGKDQAIADLKLALAKAEQSEERWLRALLEMKGLTQHAVALVRETKEAS